MTEVYVGNIWKGGKTVVGKLDNETLQVEPIKPFDVLGLNNANTIAYNTNSEIINVCAQDDFETKINGIPVCYHNMCLRIGKYCYDFGVGVKQYVLKRSSDWNKIVSDSVFADGYASNQVQLFNLRKAIVLFLFYYVTYESDYFIARGTLRGLVNNKPVDHNFILKLSKTGELLGTFHTDSEGRVIKNCVQFDESLTKYYLMQKY